MASCRPYRARTRLTNSRNGTPATRTGTRVEPFRATLSSGQDGEATPSRRGRAAIALKVGGKLLAMPVNDRLVGKLLRRRGDALVAAGQGKRVAPWHGRVMNERIAVDPESDLDWLPPAAVAMPSGGGKR